MDRAAARSRLRRLASSPCVYAGPHAPRRFADERSVAGRLSAAAKTKAPRAFFARVGRNKAVFLQARSASSRQIVYRGDRAFQPLHAMPAFTPHKSLAHCAIQPPTGRGKTRRARVPPWAVPTCAGRRRTGSRPAGPVPPRGGARAAPRGREGGPGPPRAPPRAPAGGGRRRRIRTAVPGAHSGLWRHPRPGPCLPARGAAGAGVGMNVHEPPSRGLIGYYCPGHARPA